MSKRLYVLGTLLCLVFPTLVFSQNIRPAKPTHYFFSPTAYVNDPYDLVISLHEISFALPANLQLQTSIIDNVGRLNLGAKYGFSDRLSLGGGMAWSFISFDRGGHAIKDYLSPRLGLFLAYGLAQTKTFEACIIPQTQIGDHFSIGVDFALMGTPHPVWSFIWELGTSLDVTGEPDPEFYINTDAGFRIHPPSIPFLSFDVGIDLVETRLWEHYSPHVFPYFDVIFAMKTGR